MKSTVTISSKLFGGLLVAMLAFASQNLNAQVFVANQSGSIGEYTVSGATINPNLITGLPTSSGAGPEGLAVEATSNGYNLFAADDANGAIYEYQVNGGTVSAATTIGTVPSGMPTSLAVSGTTLYIADDDTGNVLKYDLSGSSPVQSTVVTGQGDFSPRALALGGSNLYITDTNNVGSVVEYVPGTGTSNVLSSTTDSNVAYPIGIAVSGNNLFITNNNTNSVSEYALSGTNNSTAIGNNLFSLTGLNNPIALAVSGNDLLVSSASGSTIKAYSISGNGAVDTSFTTITDTSLPEQIAVLAPVPELSSGVLTSLASAVMIVCVLLRRRLPEAKSAVTEA